MFPAIVCFVLKLYKLTKRSVTVLFYSIVTENIFIRHYKIIINNNKDILAGSPRHKKVVFSGALHKINNKYDKNG